jgi:hypothetical protein
MYRLKVKIGRSWKIGRVLYSSYLEAQTRQIELSLIGANSIIVNSEGGEI